MIRNGIVPYIAIAELMMPITFAIIALLRRPHLIKGPPQKLPIVSPTIADELISVL